jgi:hypothetical protein
MGSRQVLVDSSSAVSAAVAAGVVSAGQVDQFVGRFRSGWVRGYVGGVEQAPPIAGCNPDSTTDSEGQGLRVQCGVVLRISDISDPHHTRTNATH